VSWTPLRLFPVSRRLRLAPRTDQIGP